MVPRHTVPVIHLALTPRLPPGQKGRDATAAIDVVMKAEVLSYSRSKGLFVGISLEGSTLRSDGSANEKLYGQKLTAKEIIRDGKAKAPPSASDLSRSWTRRAPRTAPILSRWNNAH